MTPRLQWDKMGKHCSRVEYHARTWSYTLSPTSPESAITGGRIKTLIFFNTNHDKRSIIINLTKCRAAHRKHMGKNKSKNLKTTAVKDSRNMFKCKTKQKKPYPLRNAKREEARPGRRARTFQVGASFAFIEWRIIYPVERECKLPGRQDWSSSRSTQKSQRRTREVRSHLS